mmetsp:Transcript_20798/g.19823  ORF Transcript_20798/g.19823 Transcript_20798/m.19823 type:complete len:155 (+) Transcript_20798:1036-1500(+)
MSMPEQIKVLQHFSMKDLKKISQALQLEEEVPRIVVQGESELEYQESSSSESEKSQYNVYGEGYINEESISLKSSEDKEELKDEVQKSSNESILEAQDKKAVEAEESLAKALSFDLGISKMKDKIGSRRRQNVISPLFKLQTDKFAGNIQDLQS